MTSFAEHKYVEGNWHCRIIEAYAEALYTQYQTELNYLEIGVRYGSTFNAVLPYSGNEAVGVDVEDVSGYMRGGEFYHGTSDDFFGQYMGPKFDIIFIDGLHTYYQVKKDYTNARATLNPDGVIFIHDAWPVELENENACGTVWQFVEELEDTELVSCAILKAFPGLAIVTNNESYLGFL